MSGVLAFNFLLFVMMHTISFLLGACDMYHQQIYKGCAIYSEDVSIHIFGRKDLIIAVDATSHFVQFSFVHILNSILFGRSDITIVCKGMQFPDYPMDHHVCLLKLSSCE